MAWTTPGTAVAGEVLTAAYLNTNIRDNTDYLYALSSSAIKFTIKTDTQTTSLSSGAAYPIKAQGGASDFGITHAVLDSAHRVVLFAQVHHQVSSSINQGAAYWTVDSSPITALRGDSAGNRRQVTVNGGSGELRIMANLFMQGVYTPGDTASHFYGIDIVNATTVTQTNRINVSSTDTDSALCARGVTSLILMEVGPE